MNSKALVTAVLFALLGVASLVLYTRRLEVEASGGERFSVLMIAKPVKKDAILSEDDLSALAWKWFGMAAFTPPRGTPSMAVRAVTRLRDDYRRLSRVKRLMLPLAGLLALLAVAQPSHAGERATSTTLPVAPVPNALERLPAQHSVLPVVPRGPLPSPRPLHGRNPALGPQERVVYHKAIEAMLAGDFQTAYRLYDALAQAHPDAADIRAAHRVLAAKIRTAH